MKRVTFASVFGTALETYDLYLYGTSAALVFAPLFFPNSDPGVSLILSLTTFAISFIARPVGSIVLGHFGDRIGRKKLLFLTLLMMGLSTAAIGALPTYGTAGIWAVILLCALRFIQGFAFAGEYAGAVLMLVEHAPSDKRGFYAGLNNTGPVFGFILSSGLFLAVSSYLSEEAFLGWGWRIPFLVSLVLVLIGLYVRARVPESPVFEASTRKPKDVKAVSHLPLVHLLRHYPKQVLLAGGSNICHFATFYLFTVFSLSYGTGQLGLSRVTVLSVAMIAVATHLFAIPYAAARSDRIGRRKALIQGLLAIGVSIFPFWVLFNTGEFIPMLIGSCLLMIAYSFVYGVLPSFNAEVFPTDVRFTGSAIAYNIGGIMGGSVAPIFAAMLIAHYGSVYPVAAYIVFLALVSLTCVMLSPETKGHSLTTENKIV
jgi:metabolite-proton symporter